MTAFHLVLDTLSLIILESESFNLNLLPSCWSVTRVARQVLPDVEAGARCRHWEFD